MREAQTDLCVEFVGSYNRFNSAGVNRRSVLRYYNAALSAYFSFGSYGPPRLASTNRTKGETCPANNLKTAETKTPAP